KADQTVVIYILYNLLKNALYYPKDYPDSIVTIGAETSDPSLRGVENDEAIHNVEQNVSQNISVKATELAPTTIASNSNDGSSGIDYSKYNVIYVHDTGPGIPPEIIPKLFNDFFTSGKKDGTGLGLSFCKRNMKIFDGDIIVESQYTPPAPLNKGEKEGDESQYTPPAPLNKGEKEGVKITNNNWTKFSMLFPKLSEEELIKAKEAIKQQTLKEQEEKRLKQLGQATIIENDIRQISNKIFNHQRTLQSLGTKQDILKLIKGKKAIIADDSPVSLTMLKNFLTTNGLEITTAQDGKELLNIYKNSLDQNGKSSFDLILTDINMGSSKTTEEEIRMLKDFSSKQSDFSQSNQNNLNGDFASLAIRRIEAQNNPDKIMANTQIRPYETNSKSDKIYIIAISGDGQEKDIRHFFNCGMNDYFIKALRAYPGQPLKSPHDLLENAVEEKLNYYKFCIKILKDN
ncbi:MAG: response regulator, partial [Bacteroidetes bacterium]|nr:response regulator [Bacteroidota bacterium]